MFNVLFNCFLISCFVKLGKCGANILNVQVATGQQKIQKLQENIQTDTSFPKNIGLHEVRGLEEVRRLQEVQRLQEYIQIDTSVPENIENAVYFWKRQAAELGLPFTVLRPAGLAICVITVKGTKPELPSIMLNSHADVVPAANADLWTHPPFSGHIDDKGNLYGRGAQDCKSTGVQYLEAIRILRQQNITLERTVHITVMPDEETGGSKGMVPFVKTKEFKSMNIGFALDEGVPSPNDALFAVYMDKRPWQMKIVIQGAGGHGSIMNGESTVDQVQTLINTALAYRNQQFKLMESRAPTDFEYYTSFNINMIHIGSPDPAASGLRSWDLFYGHTKPLCISPYFHVMPGQTVLQFSDFNPDAAGYYPPIAVDIEELSIGGVAANVAPSRMSVVMDARLAVAEDVSHFQSMINSWVAQLGNNTKLEFLRRVTSTKATATDDSNPYWFAMRDTLGKLGLTVLPIVCPGTTDMIEVRNLDIPAFGFTTNRNMPIKAHDVDEYIPLNTYLDGIKIYAVLIPSLANLPAS